MRGFKPSQAIWERVNPVIMGESGAVVINTFNSAMCAMLVQSGVAKDEAQARAHLAAVLLSPDTSGGAGSLLPLLKAELDRLDAEKDKWVT